jgi:hypothetical protein
MAGRGSTAGEVRSIATDRCSWCRRRLPDAARTGRPRKYCRRSCRQRAFEARQRLGELGWGEDTIRAQQARLDELTVAQEAIGDVVAELREELADEGSWLDHEEGRDLVERLEAILRESRAQRT